MLLTRVSTGATGAATSSGLVASLARGIARAVPTMDRRAFLRRSGLGVGAGMAASQLTLVRKAHAADPAAAAGGANKVEVKRTVCGHCSVGCAVDAVVENDHSLDIRNDDKVTVRHNQVHTVGGVVNATEPLMQIVPETERLIVEVRIAPQDIDQVHASQPARVRFTAFNQRTTPELNGTLFRVASDVTKDPQTGAMYFTGGVSLTEEELRRLKGAKLIAGMPADAFIRTGERTFASYLVKPLSDQMQRSLRER